MALLAGADPTGRNLRIIFVEAFSLVAASSIPYSFICEAKGDKTTNTVVALHLCCSAPLFLNPITGIIILLSSRKVEESIQQYSGPAKLLYLQHNVEKIFTNRKLLIANQSTTIMADDKYNLGLLDDDDYKVSVLRTKMLGIGECFMYRLPKGSKSPYRYVANAYALNSPIGNLHLELRSPTE